MTESTLMNNQVMKQVAENIGDLLHTSGAAEIEFETPRNRTPRSVIDLHDPNESGIASSTEAINTTPERPV